MDKNEGLELDMDLLKQYLANAKKYAGYFTGAEKPLEEVLVVEQWANAHFSEDSWPFVELRPRIPGEDPPDCEATGKDGGKLGFEVTELVDQNLRQKWQSGDGIDLKNYSKNEFLEAIANRLKRKDKPASKWKGGPYQAIRLIIYCDEMLCPTETKEWLEDAKFLKPQEILEAFLLLSPPPNSSGNPPKNEHGLVFQIKFI